MAIARKASLAAMADHAAAAAALLKVLANEQRLAIVCRLVTGEASVGELNDYVALSQSALSQHLAVLRSEGVVTTRKEGQLVYYRLLDGPARQVLETLYAIYCAPRKRHRR